MVEANVPSFRRGGGINHCNWCSTGEKRQAVIAWLLDGYTVATAAVAAGCNVHYAYDTADEARARGCLPAKCPCGVQTARVGPCRMCRQMLEQAERRAANAHLAGAGHCPDCHAPTPRGGRCFDCCRLLDLQRARHRRRRHMPKPPRSPRVVRKEALEVPVVHHLTRPRSLGFKIGALE